MNVKRWTLGAVALSLAGAFLVQQPAQPSWAQEEEQPQAKGLLFRLSPGSPEMSAEGKLPRANVTPLSAQEINTLLQRLPAIIAPPDDKKAFALRESSKPAPRTAATVAVSFPPRDQRPVPTVVAQSLQVTSFAPKGEVEMAPHLTVSFNQPMVPISTVEQLEAKNPPVRITPQPPGNWRWLGTQTLMFVPTIRFPMATSFHVEIPAGISSASGQKLATAQNFDFQTPPVQLETHLPDSQRTGLKPMIFLRFNQDIDPQAVARTIQVKVGSTPVAFRPATPEEVTLDKGVRGLADGSGKKRWMALLPVQPLSPGTTYSVQVGPATPSLEGPRTTTAAQSFSFATYDPLRVDGKPGDVTPLADWYIQFNNSLDASKFNPSMVRVTPELPGFQVNVQSNSMTIHGRSRGRTAYTVSIDPSLSDTFGQRLGHKEVLVVKVGSAQPAFSGPSQAFTVLDPSGPRDLTCNVINYPRLKVRAWRVQPSDWAGFLKYLQEHQRNPKDLKAPGELVIDKEIETHAGQDELTEVKVNLAAALKNNLGQLMVSIEPMPKPALNSYYRPQFVGWVQSTHIGLDAMADHEHLLAWASDLATGKALAGVDLRLAPGGVLATSDASGLAKLPLGGLTPLLVAQKGDDVAILPRDFSYWYSNGWTKVGDVDQQLWYVMDDRNLYKPGEKVSVKGWLRRATYGPLSDVLATGAKSLSYRLIDSRGNEISKGVAKIGLLGGFNLEVELPKTLNLGNTRLELTADNGSVQNHAFEVQEFRRPEFEVNATASPSSTVVGEHSSVTASAAYFAGGPLANAEVNWSVSSTPTTYSPPHWAEFTFGTWTPWWSYRSWWNESADSQGERHETQQTRTDATGKSTLRLDFEAVDPPQPTSVTAEASVQNVNRQVWSTSSTILVHPAALYVGLKNQRTFVEKGQPLELSAVVADLNGKAVSGKKILIKAYRLDWDYSTGQMKVKHADASTQQLVSSGQPIALKIATGEGGTYQIEASIKDDNNRRNRCQMTAWVAGGKQPPSRSVEQETVSLIPSKKQYDPSETAEVLVQAPFAPAEAVVTVRRNGLAEVRRISMPSGSTTLKFPLKEIYVPGLTIQVDTLGSKVRSDADGKDLPGKPQRPAYATGTLTLDIAKTSRKLSVEVVPESKNLVPGAETWVNLKLKDGAGHPISGEVALVMVDEAVLALTGYDPADPLSSFCYLPSPDVGDSHLRQYVLLSKLEPPVMRDEAAPGGGVMRSGAPMPMAMAPPPRPAPALPPALKPKKRQLLPPSACAAISTLWRLSCPPSQPTRKAGPACTSSCPTT